MPLKVYHAAVSEQDLAGLTPEKYAEQISFAGRTLGVGQRVTDNSVFGGISTSLERYKLDQWLAKMRASGLIVIPAQIRAGRKSQFYADRMPPYLKILHDVMVRLTDSPEQRWLLYDGQRPETFDGMIETVGDTFVFGSHP